MRHYKDDWPKPRSRAQRLTLDEINTVRSGFVNRRRIEDVARELQCASRTVTKYYGLYRAEGVEQRRKANV